MFWIYLKKNGLHIFKVMFTQNNLFILNILKSNLLNQHDFFMLKSFFSLMFSIFSYLMLNQLFFCSLGASGMFSIFIYLRFTQYFVIKFTLIIVLFNQPVRVLTCPRPTPTRHMAENRCYRSNFLHDAHRFPDSIDSRLSRTFWCCPNWSKGPFKKKLSLLVCLCVCVPLQ